MSLSIAQSCLRKAYAHQKVIIPFVAQAVRYQHKSASADGDSPLVDMTNPFEREKKCCILCKHNIEPDYKNVRLLAQFQSSYTGRIYGRHITGLCLKKQQKVEMEISKAQRSGMMPVYFKDLNFVKDPRLFDPENPIRPHHF